MSEMFVRRLTSSNCFATSSQQETAHILVHSKRFDRNWSRNSAGTGKAVTSQSNLDFGRDALGQDPVFMLSEDTDKTNKKPYRGFFLVTVPVARSRLATSFEIVAGTSRE